MEAKDVRGNHAGRQAGKGSCIGAVQHQHNGRSLSSGGARAKAATFISPTPLHVLSHPTHSRSPSFLTSSHRSSTRQARSEPSHTHTTMAASHLAVLSVLALLAVAATAQAPSGAPAAAPKAPATPPPAMPPPTPAPVAPPTAAPAPAPKVAPTPAPTPSASAPAPGAPTASPPAPGPDASSPSPSAEPPATPAGAAAGLRPAFAFAAVAVAAAIYAF